MNTSNEILFGNANSLNDKDIKTPSSSQFYSQINYLNEIPIPVTIEALSQIKDSNEKYQIDCQKFGTIKLIGTIINFEIDDQSCVTYKLIDIHMEDIKMAPTFTVIRYHGVDFEPNLCKIYKCGAQIQTVGKLRFFNNRLSLISFYIREISDAEIEIFQLEAKLANYFYKKNIFERNVTELEEFGVSLLSGLAVQKNVSFVSQLTQTKKQISNTFSQLSTQKIYNNNYGLLGQQSKIVSFIKQNSGKECGVSIDEIIIAINPDNNLLNDLNYLLSEGIIYNTLDENHFSVV